MLINNKSIIDLKILSALRLHVSSRILKCAAGSGAGPGHTGVACAQGPPSSPRKAPGLLRKFQPPASTVLFLPPTIPAPRRALSFIVGRICS